MDFRISAAFNDSLSRLTSQEQKAAKTTAFDLQMNPSAPGLSFHKLDRAKDSNFWSVRVNADIRLIVHRTASSLLLVYVDHHDKAYAWAERRRIERHPTTGAMQLVEIRERVEEIAPPRPATAPAPDPKPKPFANLSKGDLMGFGVPEDWVDDVRRADEDNLHEVARHLPQEAQEALLQIAVGEKPDPPSPTPIEADPFAHPDAQRRFRVLTNVEELQRALDAPWETWAVFLHPAQRALVERTYSGPARVCGSAGTGKTIVALHRAVHLARADPKARVLLTTFSNGLAHALRTRLMILVGNEPAVAARISVKAIRAAGYDLYAARHGQPNVASSALTRSLLVKAAAAEPGHRFSERFLWGEWTDVVDAWGLRSWEAYQSVSRLGRKTRIGGKQRESLWAIFERVRAGLAEKKAVTWADIFGRLAADMAAEGGRPFDHAIVDEAQDLSVAEARFLSALAGDKPDGLLLAGDLGQRIFQSPFSWRELGLDVRGRSFTLRINYRTSHQIRLRADRLLPGAVSDVDGDVESRRGVVSTFDGPVPIVRSFATEEQEQEAVGRWIAEQIRDGRRPHEIGLIIRSENEMKRARAALKSAGLRGAEIDERTEPELESVAISTMRFAKGLEFKCVAVMACDEEIIPSQERIESVADPADLEEVYETERHLLYVACTRARDHLLVTGIEPGSEFLADVLKAGHA